LIATAWPSVAEVRADEPDLGAMRLICPLPYPLPQPTCGVYSFYLCGKSMGFDELTIKGLQQELSPIGPKGVSMSRLADLAREKHIPVQAVVTSLEQLIAGDRPAILHVDQHHYIAFLGSNQSGVVLFDSHGGLISCPVERFAASYDWHGTALVFGAANAGANGGPAW